MKIKEEAQELKSLLGVISSPQPTPSAAPENSIVDETPEELEPEPIFDFDYKKVKKYYLKKAKESIIKIVRVVIDNDTIIDKSFIADKIEQDAHQLAELYYQQRKHEVMQEANMESVRKGNVSPRMFETFSVLGKNLMDITKQISDFQISIKENYAKIKFDSYEDGPSTPMLGNNAQELHQLQQQNVFQNSKALNLSIQEERKKRLIMAQETKFEEISND